MKCVYPNLADRMDTLQVTSGDIAFELNMSESKLLSKMKGVTSWTLTEAVAVCCLLKMSDVRHLFYKDGST